MYAAAAASHNMGPRHRSFLVREKLVVVVWMASVVVAAATAPKVSSSSLPAEAKVAELNSKGLALWNAAAKALRYLCNGVVAIGATDCWRGDY